jgi:hypothetical protein
MQWLQQWRLVQGEQRQWQQQQQEQREQQEQQWQEQFQPYDPSTLAAIEANRVSAEARIVIVAAEKAA